MPEQQTRVARDGRGPRVTYEDLEVGADLGTLEWSVTAESVAGLRANDQDDHEWYVGDSPFGGPVVPPMATYPPVRILFSRRYNLRGLFYRFESHFHRPIRFGQVVTITGIVAEKYVKRDREYVTYEAEGRDPDGQLLFTTRRTHVLDFIPASAPRQGAGIDSGVAAD